MVTGLSELEQDLKSISLKGYRYKETGKKGQPSTMKKAQGQKEKVGGHIIGRRLRILQN